MELAQVALDADAARRLTERIRIAAVNYSEAKEKLLRLVSEAKDGSAHVALGYKSWQAYLSEVLGEEPMRLTRDERPEVSRLLTTEGMSTRAIAPIVGSSYDTVQRDIRTDRNLSVDEPRVSHGLDGKTRTHQPMPAASASTPAPVPQPDQHAPKPRRKPLADTVHRLAADVDLRLAALYDAADDRASTVKDDVRIILHRWHRHMEDIEAAYGIDGQNEAPAESDEGSQ